MDEFTKGLKNQLERAVGGTVKVSPWGEVNPLVTIGLTEAILDLGLNEAQVYAVIRSYGRQLAAQVHPDRKPTNISVQRQRQIMSAFDFLDDEERFNLALSDFRTIKADDRRESKILRMTVSALRLQLGAFQSGARDFLENKRRFEEDRAEYERLKKEEPFLVPGLQEDIRRLSETLETEQRNNRDRVRRLVGERDALQYKVTNIRKELNKKYGIWKRGFKAELNSVKRKSQLGKDKLKARIKALKLLNSSMSKEIRDLERKNKADKKQTDKILPTSESKTEKSS